MCILLIIAFICPIHHIPYKGGLFYLKIIFPDDYPTGKPEILFLSSIYHLKVKFFRGKDKLLGHICENTLNDWNSGDSVKKILPELFSLLHKNNSDSPYDYNDNSRRNEFVNNRALFDKKAQYLAKKYSPSFTKLKEFPNVYLFSSISCPSGALIYISGFSFAFGESTTEWFGTKSSINFIPLLFISDFNQDKSPLLPMEGLHSYS